MTILKHFKTLAQINTRFIESFEEMAKKEEISIS